MHCREVQNDYSPDVDEKEDNATQIVAFFSMSLNCAGNGSLQMEVLLSAAVVLMLHGTTSAMDSDFVAVPKDFLIGTGTSAYQTEGAWNESGKGKSVWDEYVHQHPEFIEDRATADVTTDSYHKYKKDIEILKQLKVDFYRFSISWSRILPKGHVNEQNQEGVDFYNNLINELQNNSIQSVVTMYHADLPKALQDLGGWANPVMADLFADYARLLFTKFGDRVKWWITISDPEQVANSYNSSLHFAPGVDSPLVGKYLAVHTCLKAHARAYEIYKNDFHTQRGNVGIALQSRWFEPRNNSSTADKEAAERALQFELGLFANPIFSEAGDYPQVVKDTLQKLSEQQGFPRSRLRNFTDAEVELIKGKYDFLGLNYYTSRLVEPGRWSHALSTPDNQVNLLVDPTWPNSSCPDIQAVPRGIRSLLKWIKDKYKNPKMFITENGFPDDGEERDTDRIKYIVSHMSEVLKAKNEDGCDIIGFTVWNLMDSFEWDKGYTQKYGLYKVNLSDPELERKPKSSAYDLSEICKKRKLPTYFLQVTGEIDVNMDFFDHERNGTATAASVVQPTSAGSHKPLMYVWLALVLIIPLL